MSSLRFASLLGTLGLLAGCPQEPESKLCPGTGILCPEDMYCGAVQPICLTTACGNGLIDPGEECDDGNVLGQDTCSPICRREACGNSVLDPGEVCDDGNAAAGDGCSPNCMSKEVCGNSIVDQGEACDDGNTMNADGCSGTPQTVGTEMSPGPCKSTEVCGNGIKDIQTGEVCDDANTMSGDGCNSDCRSGEGCGNGFVDPGEQCDDGNANNNDACLNTCRTAKCGDGVVNSAGGETCDPSTTGNPSETATCNIDCTARVCGDGKVNQTGGESCDNGVGNNGDTRNCTGMCVLNVCGDGKVDMQAPGTEQCDDGNQNNTDGCSNACALASCGNSTVDSGEQCDDGNMTETDACVMCFNAVCGDGQVRTGVEFCDDGNTANGDGCSSSCRAEGCGNGTLDPGEECDDGNAINTDACVQGCRIAVCGDTFIRMTVEQCDDGNVINGDGCSSNCRPEGCGNGQLDPGEACDDGNMANGDGCSMMCTFEGCGDGLVNNGEACDGNGAGVGGETTTCNVDCTLRTCGDAKVNATSGEQCDAGTIMGVNQNANNRDCRADCRINICTDGFRNTVGPTRFEACDDGNMVATDGCSNNCTLASCGNGLLDPTEQCDDQNTVETDSCIDCLNARCGDSHVEADVEECDGPPVTVMGVMYTCTSACNLRRCGNGIIDVGEECDNDVKPPGPAPGSLPLPGDGCNQFCQIEFCGDGLDNNLGHEECDAGPNGDNLCNRNCTLARCGDGVTNPFHTVMAGEIPGAQGALEQCDPPSANGGCNAFCRFENCGDGFLQSSEECDVVNGTPRNASGPLVAGHSCASCLEVFCGNNEIEPANPAASEQCEPPNTQKCSATCQNIFFCGDKIVTSPNTAGFMETCEPALATPATCDPDCTAPQCGDGLTNAATGEQCDPNTGTTAMTTTAANDAATCDEDCTVTRCGDGHINDSGTPDLETCDEGATQNLPCTYSSGSTVNTCSRCNPTCNGMITQTGPYCGDGLTTNGESCDQGAANGTPCAYGDTTCTRCNAMCSGLMTTMTVPPLVTTRCGDNVIQAGNGEDCDGSASFTKPCSDFGHTQGTVTCTNATCTFDTTGCSTPPLPTCSDGTKNQMETGLDCGGSGNGCQRCALGAGCYLNSDCANGACVGAVGMTTLGTCTATCTDGYKNGAESDVDCGGGTCTDCRLGKLCNAGDCLSPNVCTAGTCQPPPPSCGDGVKNQGAGVEACDGTDFGGATCSSILGAGSSGPLNCNGSCTMILTNMCSEPFSCGDGIVTGIEQCDDDGTMNGNGCSSSCMLEAGYYCSGAPSTCITICGDGVKAASEGCEPPNVAATMAAPGCSATCMVIPMLPP